jgi:hypothetical protein
MTTPKDNYEMFKEITSNGYEAAQELADINLRTLNNMLQKQMDIYNIWVEAGIKQIELNANFKDQKDYLASHAALTREIGKKLIASGKDTISSGNAIQGEYRSWYEKSVQTMTDDWNKAGKQVVE